MNSQIEDISLLNEFQNNLVEINFDISGVNASQYIENLSTEITDKYIILDSETEETQNIHISRDNITGIDQEYTGCCTIYMLHGDITITKL